MADSPWGPGWNGSDMVDYGENGQYVYINPQTGVRSGPGAAPAQGQQQGQPQGQPIGNGSPSMPNDQAQSGTIGDPYANNPGGNPNQYQNGNSYDLQTQGQGGFGSTPAPQGYNPQQGFNPSPYGSPGQVGANNAAGGYGGPTMSGAGG